ncbi:MAG: hypothetical protein AAB458_02190 [Patescibacteria group bacterium]
MKISVRVWWVLSAIFLPTFLFCSGAARAKETECPSQIVYDELTTRVVFITRESLQELLKEGEIGAIDLPAVKDENNALIRVHLSLVKAHGPVMIWDFPLPDGKTISVLGVFVLARVQADSGPLSSPGCYIAGVAVDPELFKESEEPEDSGPIPPFV